MTKRKGGHVDPAVVRYEVVDGIAHIRLERPNAHNALSPASIRLLADAWRQYALDRSARVAILSGIGPSFCSGRDMKLTHVGMGYMRNAEEPGPCEDDEWASLPCERRRIQYVPPPDLYKPVIAAVHGMVLGGGLELALSCDVRIAASDSRLGLPEVTRGVIPGSGGLYWLARIVGVGAAMEMALSGRIVNAEEALAMRLVNRVVDVDRLQEAAHELAIQISRNAPLAVQAVKETVWRTLGSGPDEGLRVSEHQNRVLPLSQDAHEGYAAFLEKRPPRYQGR